MLFQRSSIFTTATKTLYWTPSLKLNEWEKLTYCSNEKGSYSTVISTQLRHSQPKKVVVIIRAKCVHSHLVRQEWKYYASQTREPSLHIYQWYASLTYQSVESKRCPPKQNSNCAIVQTIISAFHVLNSEKWNIQSNISLLYLNFIYLQVSRSITLEGIVHRWNLFNIYIISMLYNSYTTFPLYQAFRDVYTYLVYFLYPYFFCVRVFILNKTSTLLQVLFILPAWYYIFLLQRNS